MKHDDDEQRDPSDQPRGIRRSDGGHLEAAQDEEGTPSVDADDDAARRLDNPGEVFQHLEVVEFLAGPVPPPHVLDGYNQIVPGAAAKIIDAHLDRERAGTAAIDRLTKAEARGVTIGAVAAPAIVLTGLVVAAILIATGHPWQSALGVLPAIIAAGAQLVAAYRKSNSEHG